MEINMFIKSLCFKLVAVFSLILLSVGVTGCDSCNKTPPPPPPPTVDGKGIELLPIRVGFKQDGTPVLIDEAGKPIKTRKEKFPLKTEKIYSLKTFSIGFLEGSCNEALFYGDIIDISQVDPEVCALFADL